MDYGFLMAGLWQPPGYNGSVIPEVSAKPTIYSNKRGEKNLIVRILALIGKNLALGNISAWLLKDGLVSHVQKTLQCFKSSAK